MPYMKTHTALARRPRSRRHAMHGLGDTYNDDTPCGSIPSGDPYRKAGNYCTDPAGGLTTFECDGTLSSSYASGNSPNCPGGSSSSSSGGSAFDTFLNVFTKTLATPTATPGMVVASGMSDTTKIALAGGAVLLLVVLATR